MPVVHLNNGGCWKRAAVLKTRLWYGSPLLIMRALAENYSICDGIVYVTDGLDDDGYLDYYVVVS